MDERQATYVLLLCIVQETTLSKNEEPPFHCAAAGEERSKGGGPTLGSRGLLSLVLVSHLCEEPSMKSFDENLSRGNVRARPDALVFQEALPVDGELAVSARIHRLQLGYCHQSTFLTGSCDLLHTLTSPPVGNARHGDKRK